MSNRSEVKMRKRSRSRTPKKDQWKKKEDGRKKGRKEERREAERDGRRKEGHRGEEDWRREEEREGRRKEGHRGEEDWHREEEREGRRGEENGRRGDTRSGRRGEEYDERRGDDREGRRKRNVKEDDGGGDKRNGQQRMRDEDRVKDSGKPAEPVQPSKATSEPKPMNLLTRTGGAYIPPGKLRLMQESITDKSSMAYQRIAWEALKKSIHGQINKVNTSNIGIVARLLFKENIVRGRGLLCRSIIQAQAASPTFTNVYACLVAIVNSKFPNIGELLLKRVIIQFKRAFKRGDKPVCISSTTFLAHLINQRVAHEIIGLEIVSLLVENPTDDSVEIAIAFLKECGQKLSEVTSKGCNAVFDMLRNILHEGKLDKRVQYMIEVMFQVRKDDFKDFPAVTTELDLIDEEDQFTHLVTLDDATDPQDLLNVFKMDQEYEANEDKYKELRSEILDGSDDSSQESGDDSSDEESDKEEKEAEVTILDRTETNLIALRKTIYLTIQSSLDFEECAHKLLKMEIKPGQEKELCHMFLDCCAEQRTYEKFFGLLAQRFCQINKLYVSPFEEIFQDTYATVHRLDTNKLRNVAKFFAHLLFTDAISWNVLSTIKLNEEDTTSSSRIFIKILFQELSEYMGLSILNGRLKDPVYSEAMEGLFPRDSPKNTRFAINFFTSIGLGGLTDELRVHLQVQPKVSAIPQLIQNVSSSEESCSSSSESNSSSSESSSESSESEDEKVKKKKKTKLNKNPHHRKHSDDSRRTDKKKKSQSSSNRKRN